MEYPGKLCLFLSVKQSLIAVSITMQHWIELCFAHCMPYDLLWFVDFFFLLKRFAFLLNHDSEKIEYI